MRVRFWYSLIFLIPIFILTIILMMISLMSPTAGATTTGPTVTPAPITSQNVELIKQMGGSAFAVSAQGSYVYLGNGPSLIVLDVSDPAQPVQIGQIVLPDIVNGVVVTGSYAYVVTEGAGLRIINVSDPAVPVETGFANIPATGEGVAVVGDYAYVAAGSAGLYRIPL